MSFALQGLTVKLSILKKLNKNRPANKLQIALRGSWCVVRWILATSFRPTGQERAPKSRPTTYK